MVTEIAAQVAGQYELPGEAVFPESICVDAATGDAYVGSLADGTLYRLTGDGKAQEFAFPTAVSLGGGRLLVVNSQLNAMGGQPGLPFTVVAVAGPEAW